MGDRRITHPRRDVLRAAALAGMAAVVGGPRRMLGQTPASRPVFGPVRPRPDLLDPGVRDELELVQLTTGREAGSTHIYMESQVFTPDSRRLVLQYSGHPHGSDRKDPRHQFLLCDTGDRFSLTPLTTETGTTGPVVSPDGRFFYYFVDETGARRERLSLNRVNLDGTDRRTLLVVDGNLPGTRFRPTRVYPLSTISSDGTKIAISACMDRSASPVEFGLMVFDLERASVEVIIHGPTFTNMHPQFCRSQDPVLRRDILIQENHARLTNPDQESLASTDKAGADIHVVRDDGTELRTLPWGRDGVEFCEGHQCWRGRTGWAITSADSKGQACLIEALPVKSPGHEGLKTPGGIRNVLTRGFANPQFHHFATDLAGERLISDYSWSPETACIYVARLGRPGEDALRDFRCVARPRPAGLKTSHMHPFLSPDGRMAFFNSDESGILQAYAIRGLPA